MYNLQETDVKVFTTNRYELFKRMKGNRPINPAQVRKLKDSMREHGFLMCPIIVNDKFEVIDGQHRIEAAEDLDLSVLIMFAEGYGQDEMIAQNMAQHNWNKKAYLNFYCEKGYDHYLAMREFMNHYNFVSVNDSMKLLQNSASKNDRSYKYYDDGRDSESQSQVFEEGTWEVNDIDLAYEWADQIKAISEYYSGYKRSNFISTMISLFKSEKFNFDKFLKKLKSQQTKMVDCANQEQYRLLIEEIYNHGSGNKINLRYL